MFQNIRVIAGGTAWTIDTSPGAAGTNSRASGVVVAPACRHAPGMTLPSNWWLLLRGVVARSLAEAERDLRRIASSRIKTVT